MKILLAALLLVTSMVAWADAFQQGVVAYEKGDYSTALQKFTPLAEQGNANAQGILGIMNANGQGVTQDYKQAVHWYTLSAQQGNANAQNNLGILHEDGKGVVQDYKQAVQWYTMAAEQGNAVAQSNLGVMYDDGTGVLQDYTKAHMWSNIAAANGHKNALKNREIAAAKMTPQQIDRAQQMARDCVARNYKQCN